MEKRISIQDLPSEDRPRERLGSLGSNALSTPELLAILLRVGTQGVSAVELGSALLLRFGGLQGIHAASFEDLCGVVGMGPAKVAQIKAAIELGYRLNQEKTQFKPTMQSPEAVDREMRHLLSVNTQEEMWVLAVNTRNMLVQKQQLYKGTVNHASARMAEIFEIPIRCNASAIIVVHNHPSGDPKPSAEDIRFTEALIAAGKLLDIGVLDHIIIGKDDHYSIRKHSGLIFQSSNGRKWD